MANDGRPVLDLRRIDVGKRRPRQILVFRKQQCNQSLMSDLSSAPALQRSGTASQPDGLHRPNMKDNFVYFEQRKLSNAEEKEHDQQIYRKAKHCSSARVDRRRWSGLAVAIGFGTPKAGAIRS